MSETTDTIDSRAGGARSLALDRHRIDRAQWSGPIDVPGAEESSALSVLKASVSVAACPEIAEQWELCAAMARALGFMVGSRYEQCHWTDVLTLLFWRETGLLVQLDEDQDDGAARKAA
jgi:hypothetical protein